MLCIANVNKYTSIAYGTKAAPHVLQKEKKKKAVWRTDTQINLCTY